MYKAILLLIANIALTGYAGAAFAAGGGVVAILLLLTGALLCTLAVEIVGRIRKSHADFSATPTLKRLVKGFVVSLLMIFLLLWSLAILTKSL